MLAKFKSHLAKNFSFLNGRRLFIAVSGGIDSMVMLYLFQQLDYDFAAVHCNFNLRGEESQSDQQFVEQYCEVHDISRISGSFDTKAYAKDFKVSIQVAARELRYEWFDEQLVEKEYDYVLTAHNADDVVETFIINLTRGTGLEGLTGIAAVNEKVIRPFMIFSRKEITAYAELHSIEWREDSSNASDKYLRNKIRHHITPLLTEINPRFIDSFQNTLKYLQQSQSLAEDASVMVYQQVITEKDLQKHIDIKELLRLPNYQAYLYQWLSPFGFTAWDDIYSLLTGQSGKVVLSKFYRVVKDREVLILEPIPICENEIYQIAHGMEVINVPITLRLNNVNNLTKSSDNNVIFVAGELLKFPLFVRKWQEGDYFYPAGMNGQKKKVSKYFKDEKFSLSDKENAWLLCSEDQVVWVIGKRADGRFAANNQTKKPLKIEVL